MTIGFDVRERPIGSRELRSPSYRRDPFFVAGNGIEALEKLRDGTVPRDRKIILFVARARFSSTSCRSAGRP